MLSGEGCLFGVVPTPEDRGGLGGAAVQGGIGSPIRGTSGSTGSTLATSSNNSP